MVNKKVLVTGGSGYIGSVLVEMLVNFGYEVTVVDNLMYGQTSLLHLSNRRNLKFVYGDVSNHKILDELLKDVDFIIPLAGIVGMPACERFPMMADMVNRSHIQYITKNKREDSIIIYPNTNSGYGIGQKSDDGKPVYCTEDTPLVPISIYGKTKMAAEKDVLDCGGIVFRLATVFGVSPRMRTDLLVNDFVYKAVTDGVIVLYESDAMRNYVHIKDVCEAFMFAIANNENMRGNVYNLGLSNANLNKYELCKRIQENLPNTVIIRSEFGEDPDKRNYMVDNTKLKLCGFEAYRGIEYGISELIRAYKMITVLRKPFGNQ